MSDREDLTPADYEVAGVLADQSETFIRYMAKVAHDAGTTINLAQIIGAILGVSINLTETPITREQFTNVYDVFERQFHEVTGFDYGDGPEATADAPDGTAAGALAEHWGEVVTSAAFDFGMEVHPHDTLAEWEAELRGGINE